MAQRDSTYQQPVRERGRVVGAPLTARGASPVAERSGAGGSAIVSSVVQRSTAELPARSNAAVGRDRTGVAARLAERHSTRVLFARPKDVERWNVRLRHGLARQIELRFGGASDESPVESMTSAPDSYLLLAIRRGGDWMPMYWEWAPRVGDETTAFVLIGEEKEALEMLETMGWKQVSR